MAENHEKQNSEVDKINNLDDDLVSYGVFVKEDADERGHSALSDLSEESSALTDSLSPEEEQYFDDSTTEDICLESDLKAFGIAPTSSTENQAQNIYTGLNDDIELDDIELDTDDAGLNDVAPNDIELDTDDAGLSDFALNDIELDTDDAGLNDVAPNDIELDTDDAGLSDFALNDIELDTDDAGLNDVAPSDIELDTDDAGLNDVAPSDIELDTDDAGLNDVAPSDIELATDDAGLNDVAPSDIELATDDAGLNDVALNDTELDTDDAGLSDFALNDIELDTDDAGLNDVAPSDIELDTDDAGLSDFALNDIELDTDDAGLSDFAPNDIERDTDDAGLNDFEPNLTDETGVTAGSDSSGDQSFDDDEELDLSLDQFNHPRIDDDQAEESPEVEVGLDMYDIESPDVGFDDTYAQAQDPEVDQELSQEPSMEEFAISDDDEPATVSTTEESDVLQEVNLDDLMEETDSSLGMEETDSSLGMEETDSSLGMEEATLDDFLGDDDNSFVSANDVLDNNVVSIDEEPDTAYSEELTEINSSTVSPSSYQHTGGPDLLHSIEQELNLIKSELTDLRKELHHLRGQKSPGGAVGASASDVPDITGTELLNESAADGGFFTEGDEDETIALTGDELNNILDTADFIDGEGAAIAETPSSPPASASMSAMDSLLDQSDFGDDIGDMADFDIEDELADIENLSDEEPDSETQQMLDDIPNEIELANDPDDEINSSTPLPPTTAGASPQSGSMLELKQELKDVLSYMDSLLENLPEEKIEEFAKSEHFTTYQKLFEELGL